MSNLINKRYKLTRILGQGGYGSVFEAKDVVLNRRVALKRLHGGAFGAQIKERFLDEARITSNLRHPSALVMYDFGITEDGDPFLVTELLQGLSLQSYLEKVRFSQAQTVLLLEQVGGALIEAHRQGIIHRDIKPANLFVHSPTGVPEEGGLMIKLLDFGIAKVLSRPAGTGTRSGAIIGTPAYMAPEQIRDSSKVDVRCDQYSLGLVAYECLHGQPVVTGRDEFEVMSNQINAPLPELDLSAREIPAEGLGRLVDLIKRMTCKEQDQRYSDMSEVLETLLAVKQRFPTLSDVRFDPQPLIVQLKKHEHENDSSISAPSFEQLSSTHQNVQNRPAQLDFTPAPVRTVDSLSETINAEADLAKNKPIDDSNADTLLPDNTFEDHLQGKLNDGHVASNMSFMDTMGLEELSQPMLLPQNEESTSAVAEEIVASAVNTVKVTKKITLAVIICLFVAFLAWFFTQSSKTIDSSTQINKTEETPLQLGPQKRSRASKYKIVFDRDVPDGGFTIGEQIEILIQNNLGHQVLEYEMISVPPCLTPIVGADRPQYKIISTQCGEIEVMVGSIKVMRNITVTQFTDDFFNQLNP